ncbi:MAG: phosphotransferase family protein [Syntrophobacteraceae bacterium]
MVSSNRGGDGNDLVFLFPGRQKSPRFVTKIGRTPSNAEALTNEFKWVRFLADRQKGLGLLPVMHFSGEWNGRGYFVQDTVDGVGFDVALLRWGANSKTRSCIAQAVDFLADLQSTFLQDDLRRREDASRLFEAHLAAIDANPGQRARIKESADAVGLASCFTHGDFWATNVLIDSKRTRINGVIDFEFASDCCYSHFDIFWLVVNLPMFIGEPSFRGGLFPSYQHAFFDGKKVHMYREIFQKYFGKIGKKTPPLFDLFIVSLLHGSFRGKKILGYSTHMDSVCSEMLRWSLDNEPAFNLR